MLIADCSTVVFEGKKLSARETNDTFDLASVNDAAFIFMKTRPSNNGMKEFTHCDVD